MLDGLGWPRILAAINWLPTHITGSPVVSLGFSAPAEGDKMTNRTSKRKWFLLFASLLIAASVISAVVFSAKRQQQKRPWPKEPRVTSMPPVFSKVKSLEVVRAWVEN